MRFIWKVIFGASDVQHEWNWRPRRNGMECFGLWKIVLCSTFKGLFIDRRRWLFIVAGELTSTHTQIHAYNIRSVQGAIQTRVILPSRLVLSPDNYQSWSPLWLASGHFAHFPFLGKFQRPNRTSCVRGIDCAVWAHSECNVSAENEIRIAARWFQLRWRDVGVSHPVFSTKPNRNAMKFVASPPHPWCVSGKKRSGVLALWRW